jgi:phosphoribosylaminoimidazole carboxylase PurE protein
MGSEVAILMGSQSDEDVMSRAADTLNELGIAFEEHVLSAHRNPEKVSAFAKTAHERGVKVIIAGAGLAAHLAGAIASKTVLPVIGVPIASGGLGGMDALLSTVQMPPGVPVATVAINGGKNAAFLAAQILALSDSNLSSRLSALREQ